MRGSRWVVGVFFSTLGARARPRAAHRHTYTTVFPHIVLIPKLLFPPSYLPYIILKKRFHFTLIIARLSSVELEAPLHSSCARLGRLAVAPLAGAVRRSMVGALLRASSELRCSSSTQGAAPAPTLACPRARAP